jgi:hypothetical protein
MVYFGVEVGNRLPEVIEIECELRLRIKELKISILCHKRSLKEQA